VTKTLKERIKDKCILEKLEITSVEDRTREKQMRTTGRTIVGVTREN